ncbi:GHKL domain-containing protein [bacterium LRH843]|nr:GHKL domain-containing protein [bacterium LRH843]
MKNGDFELRKKGLMFKFQKKEGTFIHTFIEGELLHTLGMTQSKIINKTLVDLFPNDIAEKIFSFYEKAWHGEYVTYEGYIQGVHFLTSLSPIKKDSRVVEVIASVTEMARSKKQDAIIQNVDKLAMVGELAAGIAHEIKNPLTSLKGFTQMIHENLINQDLKPYVNIMLQELERINTIVNEFMLIAKPNQNIRMEQTNMNDLISNVTRFMEPQSKLYKIKINTLFDSDINAVCNSDHLKQVLINLIQNALEASIESKTDVQVILKEVNADCYVIKIIDFGNGIDEERQNNLFEPFYSTKEKGTGLGLMICKQIIDVHNGTIEVNSKCEIGTTVSLILPKNPLPLK